MDWYFKGGKRDCENTGFLHRYLKNLGYGGNKRWQVIGSFQAAPP